MPLGKEFQSLARCFVRLTEKENSKKYYHAEKLVNFLRIMANNSSLSGTGVTGILAGLPQCIALESLCVRCLQLLRAIIHNEERKLPANWGQLLSDRGTVKQLKVLKEVQDCLNAFGAMKQVLPLCGQRSRALVQETLLLISMMLFNANRNAQKAILDFFLHTRLETFFATIRTRMQMSTVALKESRALLMFQKSKKAEFAIVPEAQVKEVTDANPSALQPALAFGDLDRPAGDIMKQGLLSKQESSRPKVRNRKCGSCCIPKSEKRGSMFHASDYGDGGKGGDNNLLLPLSTGKGHGDEKPVLTEGIMAMRTGISDVEQQIENQNKKNNRGMPAYEYKDDGCINLVLRVLAAMCDGQMNKMQNYLREQPDNIKSVNIIADTARFLEVIYSNISSSTIDLAIQVSHGHN